MRTTPKLSYRAALNEVVRAYDDMHAARLDEECENPAPNAVAHHTMRRIRFTSKIEQARLVLAAAEDDA